MFLFVAMNSAIFLLTVSSATNRVISWLSSPHALEIKILTSKDAKKLYTNCTAAVLRAKACVMKTASAIQENAEDIYAEAQQINEDRAAAEEVVEDTADEAAEETEETTDFKEETEETEEGSEE